ncbi:hypothetical protein P3X46_023480 [Hevea brasiliensis]|uniref:Radical SAM core domain-containing protein n=1 Tax=Hevea brasiliensis TaxID=3981 RepID=A0ABQ9LC83_HEVBR|nr:hypothetical protein P3X46_023480 [Hevea brasiliensis]
MLKSTFTSVFSTFPSKTTTLQKLPSHSVIANVFTQRAPPIHQNSSVTTRTATIIPPLRHHPPTSAYVHLPFCRKRCHYCDFPIVAFGSANPTDADPRISNYVELLQREIVSTIPEFNNHPPLETVFFGGGTPSLVSPRLVSSILDTLRGKFGLFEDAEISMEMDPGTFDANKMEELMGLGVNRELLKACGKAHGIKEVYEALEIMRSCGVENWSMDLISSLPYQTPQMWEESLRFTVQAQPNHVSVYDLQMLSDAGYSHYEISSYGKDGFECKHNFAYWKNKPFYGFGLGSASYVNGVRFSRPRKMREMGQWIAMGINHLDAKDLAMDVLMLSLRTVRGLDLRSFKYAFGGSLVYSLCKVYKPYMESGHVVCLDEERRAMTADEFNNLFTLEDGISSRLAYIRLSDPDGFLLSNELISLAFGAIAP